MSEAPDQGAETLAPAPEHAQNAPADAPQGPDVAAEGDQSPGEAPQAQQEASEPPKKPKSPVAQLQGRVGHLTKTLHEKDTALGEAQRQIEAYRALLEAQGRAADADSAAPARPQAQGPLPGTPEYQAQLREEARRLAQQEAFTEASNRVFDEGVQKHGETFKEGVANLNALGIMSPEVVHAAIATGQAADVLNALGSDVDEAARIAALSPVQMGVEMAKLAAKLQAPKEARQVSRAPAPITPVSGANQANLDVYDPNISMEEYVRRRKAMGSRWAK